MSEVSKDQQGPRFAVGERVRVLVEYLELVPGDVGTVVRVHQGDLRAAYDVTVPGKCIDGIGENGAESHYYMHECELMPVEDALAKAYVELVKLLGHVLDRASKWLDELPDELPDEWYEEFETHAERAEKLEVPA